MADKEGMERKVYLLPSELVARIRTFQIEHNLSSEVEAARRLLNEALQMRDSIEDILIQLKARFLEEKDLRVLSRDVLSTHSLVKSIHIDAKELSFSLRNQDAGGIDSKGGLRKGNEDDQGFIRMSSWTPVVEKQEASAGLLKKPVAEKPPNIDLDDEIPF